MPAPTIRVRETVPQPAAARAEQKPIRHGAVESGGLELDPHIGELAKLLPLWPSELADRSPQGRARLIATLERALRAERRRGVAGHWTYNLARHAALLRAWRAEKAAARARARTG